MNNRNAMHVDMRSYWPHFMQEISQVVEWNGCMNVWGDFEMGARQSNPWW